MSGATTRRNAATSPVANEPATIQTMRPLDPRSGWDRRSRPVSLGAGSVATIDSIPGTVRRRTSTAIRTYGTSRQLDTRPSHVQQQLADRPELLAKRSGWGTRDNPDGWWRQRG